MNERPILFSGEMVRAILEGRKTQTRRVLDVPAGWRLESAHGEPSVLGKITSPHPKRDRFGAFIRKEIHPGSGKFQHDIVASRHGGPGDRLWVRETFQGPLVQPGDRSEIANIHAPEFCEYRADGGPTPEWIDGDDELHQGWRPSIHMPRWASRINLEITGVRVERLQDISEEDALAEGVIVSENTPQAVHQFCRLWRDINGEESWQENPWVWVIEFRQVSS